MNEQEIKQEFEKVWDKLHELEEKLNGKSSSSSQIIGKKDDTLDSEIKIFCKNNDIDEERLRYEIDFQKEYPRIINIPNEKVRTNRQYKALILLAPIYYRIYGKTLSSDALKELFILNRIPLERLDKLYNSPLFKKFFTKSKKDIRLSWAGEQEGIKKLKELIENAKTEDSK
ncbi:MAG: hypothetical protein ACOCRX_11860 [Candidatus Woesearchaeota archaeon]